MRKPSAAGTAKLKQRSYEGSKLARHQGILILSGVRAGAPRLANRGCVSARIFWENFRALRD